MCDAGAVEDTRGRVLVAGATGYVGKFAVRAFTEHGYRVRALTRSEARLAEPGPFTAPAIGPDDVDEVFVAELTDPSTLDGLMDGIDIVFSSVGISRQRDGLTFEQVDYELNHLLIGLAEAADVERFVYVSMQGADDPRRALVERPRRGLADRRVVARVDRKDLFLTREAREVLLAHVGRDEQEVRGVAADFGQITVGVDGVSLERRLRHVGPLFAGVEPSYRDSSVDSKRLPTKKKFIIRKP